MKDTAIDVGDLGPEDLGGEDLGGAGGSEAMDPAPEPGPLAELPRSLAEVTSVHDGDVAEYRLLLSPGATAAEVTAAMVLMPPASALVSHRADADILLVFREPTHPSAGAAVWPHDAGPTAGGPRSGGHPRSGGDDRSRYTPAARQPS
ncbi:MULTISPECIES: hypothetical protein [Pseudofrankia]|uniref:hypothetical protein n=1 Tax=Pseudofrankia TaxID=2994363 RepID=UPI000234B47E|nr:MULTISPECIES: hypothetical protein [Pseudofrankia]OHV32953.1 hypothetical protein BCD49_27845 [Pseudofrankia sp. EUN1h]